MPVSPSQLLVCLPQFPHGCDAGTLQVWLVHASGQRQSSPQVCRPPEPQLSLEFGAHSR
jgi:hypothetical protein